MRKLIQTIFITILAAMASTAQANCVGCWAARHRHDGEKKVATEYISRELRANPCDTPAQACSVERGGDNPVRKPEASTDNCCIEVRKFR